MRSNNVHYTKSHNNTTNVISKIASITTYNLNHHTTKMCTRKQPVTQTP